MIFFLRNSIWDMIICTALVFACATCVFSGFYVPESQVTSYAVTVGVSALLVVLMTVASYDKRSIIIGLAALAAVFAGIIVISAAGGSSLFSDTEDNPFLRFLLLIITAVVIFIASRFRAGTVLLLAAGVITLSMIEFMYESRHIVCLLIFMVAGVLMIVYRNYIYNVLHSNTLRISQTSTVTYALILCILAAALGTGIFYGIINPLHPQAKELKIITKYLSLEVLEKVGIADVETIKDPDLTTDQVDENNDTTRQDTEKKDENLNEEVSQADSLNDDDDESAGRLNKRLTGPFRAIRYDRDIPLWVIVTVFIILIIAAAIALKLWLRRRWFTVVKRKPPREQVRELYWFFMKKFRQLKVRPVTGETPGEFTSRNTLRLKPFSVEGESKHTEFSDLTDVLIRSEYGGYEPDKEDLNKFESFYRSFYPNCRVYLGKVQYIIKFFVL